jgi:hypothetical protein
MANLLNLMEKQSKVDCMSSAYSTNLMFKQLEAIATEVLAESKSRSYQFIDVENFKRKGNDAPAAAVQIYWKEMLLRAEWASLIALKRHLRWHSACCRHSQDTPNFLGFAATIRALIESAVDIEYSLGPVPSTLADNFKEIELSLAGQNGELVISSDLEERIIHFLYARRLENGEKAPKSHVALKMKEYFEASEGKAPTPLSKLYAELCQIAHPAAYSTLFFGSTIDDGTVCIEDGDDLECIEDLYSRHQEAVENAFFFGLRGVGEWHERLQGMFVDLRRGSGSTVLTSSAGAEYALESSEQKNGLFTYAVLEALDGNEGSDIDKDGRIQMSELGEYVKKRVALLTNSKQSPNTRRINIEGDFPISGITPYTGRISNSTPSDTPSNSTNSKSQPATTSPSSVEKNFFGRLFGR